ncbi:hypothetical protein KTO58_07175 [Chitinophaga pendula]|uniref:hypothetical protein n=1 Tax=Chitinophaga TaxID=79328 RepID=UPI0018E03B8A|nr:MULTISPECIES: hypothetical protein [Chitinophaga]UCJ08958.1 hypothetical protein KTO58_07175 [Chitinophaga pendula]
MKKQMHLCITLFTAIALYASACQKDMQQDHPADNVRANIANAAARAGAPSDPARASLKAMIENVKQADGRRYNAKDNAGHTMDCAKIIQQTGGNTFVAVYHTYVNGTPKVNLATSTDLINWTWIRELAGSNNGGASQPTIAPASDGGYVMAWEQEPSNHLKFVYFSSWTNLLNGAVAKSYDVSRTLSSCAEGTPNIYAASSTRVEAGYHFYHNCDVDRQARGVLSNFNSWRGSAQPNFDNALLHWGVQGNIGDRDILYDFDGYNFGLIEGQFAKGDFGTWRSFIYDYQTGNAEQLNIQTNSGSQAFANPTISRVQLNGRRALVCTFFVPSERSAPGEAGELICYKYY